jgi:hypothetical protein
MTNADYIAIASVAATLFGALVTWLVMKRQFASKKLSYSYAIEPIIRSNDPALARDLKISYKDEELRAPTLLSVEIANVGQTAIENAEIVVALPGATYLIPGYFVDLPPGYSTLWRIDRTDAEECTIRFRHINPKQVARARFLMDEMPEGEPTIYCPMANVECTKASLAKLGVVAELILKHVAPQFITLMRLK